jgi:hypothetical protein
MKLYTFVVHYLQMCMKAYGCCPKFKRGDNSTYTFTKKAYKVHNPPFRESISWIISPFKFWKATIFLHAHLQVVYYKCAKFHKNPISRLGRVVLTRYMDGRTDGRTGWFLFCLINTVNIYYLPVLSD